MTDADKVSARKVLYYTAENTLKVVDEKDNAAFLPALSKVSKAKISADVVSVYSEEWSEVTDIKLADFIREHNGCIPLCDVPDDVQKDYTLACLIIVECSD